MSCTGSCGFAAKSIEHSDRNPRVDARRLRPREERIRHRRADAVRDDRDPRDPPRPEECDRGGEPLGCSGQRDRVVVARRSGREHRHLHGERRVSGVGEKGPQPADHPEIRMDAEAVNDDDPRLRGSRRHGQDREHLCARRRREPDRLADDDPGTTSLAQRSSRASSIAGAAAASQRVQQTSAGSIGSGGHRSRAWWPRRSYAAIAKTASLPHDLPAAARPDRSGTRPLLPRAVRTDRDGRSTTDVEETMNRHRRRLICGSLAAVPLALAGARAHAQATTLKISHQFPGGTIDTGDFRDRLVRKFAQDVEKRTNGALKFDIYPNSSLVKVNSQFSALRRGALDLSLVPLSYAGGEVPETNIGLLPALVPSYEVGSKWKNAEVGKLLSQILAEKGVLIVTWIWQAGGVASRTRPLVGSRRCEGHEDPRRQPRDGHDVQGRRRVGAVAAVQRDLRGDADRRDGRGADVVDEPDLVPARGGVEVPDERARQVVLVHVRAADDVEAGLRQAAEGAAGRDHGRWRRPREIRGRERDGRRRRGRRRLRQGRRQGVRPRRSDAQEMAGARAAGVEGLRRQERKLREAARAAEKLL